MEKYIPCKWEGKESWSSNPHMRQNRLKLRIGITRDKEGHYIMIKGSIQEEDITIVNIYAPNVGAPQYIRQTPNRHKRRNCNIIIVKVKSLSCVWLLATPWTSVHGSFRARVLEWGAMSVSRGSSRPRDRTQVSHIASRCFTLWATRVHRYLQLLCLPLELIPWSLCSALPYLL